MIGLQTRKIMLQPQILQHGGRAIVAGTKERRSLQGTGTGGGVVKPTSTSPEKFPAL